MGTATAPYTALRPCRGGVVPPRPVSSDRVRLSTHRLAGGAGQPWLLRRAEWCRRRWLLAADVALVELLPVVGA